MLRHQRPRDLILAELQRLATARHTHAAALADLDRRINRLLDDFAEARKQDPTP
jgi:hypothetical protein